MSTSATDPRRRAVRLGLQIAAIVLLLLAAVGGVATLLYERAEHAVSTESLRDSTATLTARDRVPETWVTEQAADGSRVSTPGLPRGLPDKDDLRLVGNDGRARQHEHEAGGRVYAVRTEARGDGLVQVALDRTEAERASGRMVTALVVALGLGALAAAAGAFVLARKALTPVEEALVMQRRFVRDASHELRTPLTLLSTRVQMLARRAARGEASAEALREGLVGVVADTEALTDLLEDLLLAAEPAAEAEREDLDLAALVRECVESAHSHAADRGVACRVLAGGPVPVHVSRAALRRAILALVDNAVDHAGAHVELEVAARGSTVHLSVRDDGPGVPAAERARIFERFASRRDEVGPGAGRRHYGLGLALVADVAHAHGGSVAARSREDGLPGAELVLTLPRA